MAETTINGQLYDWESVEIRLPNGVAVGITEINYSDERGVEPRYGKGGTPRGRGHKNYKPSCDLTLDLDEAERLRSELGGYYAKTPFNIVVSYGNNDQATVTDTIKDCVITKVDTSAKQDEDNVGAKKLEIQPQMIAWNGSDAYSAGRDGSPGS